MGPPRPADGRPRPTSGCAASATLPLMHQPGERWMYNTGSDVLGVLIARAAGQPFETFLRERLFEPLGMKDTGFSVPAGKIGPARHQLLEPIPKSGALEVYDPAEGGQWSRPPAFPSAAGGLVSTVDDYLAFGRMLLNQRPARRGAHPVAAVGRGHDHRSADARAEGGLRLRARLLGQPRLGLRDVRGHPARRRGRGARAIRLGRRPRAPRGARIRRRRWSAS